MLVAPPAALFEIRKWRVASDATCGRCVMQSTWRPDASARRCSPTARAVWPPMPASISSNTSSGAVRPAHEPAADSACAALSSASITRESSPPEAISRSGPGRDAGIGRDHQLDRLGPRRAAAVRARRQLHLERRALHREVRETTADGCGQLGRGATARLRHCCREPVELGARGRDLGLLLLERDLGSDELLAPRCAALAVCEHGRDRATVLTLEPGQHRQAVLHLFETTRRRVDLVSVPAQLGAEVLGLVQERLQSLRARSQHRVEGADRLERPDGLGE